jgi:hypothetical protein
MSTSNRQKDLHTIDWGEFSTCFISIVRIEKYWLLKEDLQRAGGLF